MNNNTKVIKPQQTIGIIGGGQLGQMLAFSAKQSGMKVIILDPNPNCSAAQVSDEVIAADYDNFAALEQLADRADVVTYEFENVDLNALEELGDKIYLPQGTELLKITKNRLREKTFLQNHGLKTTEFVAINAPEALQAAVAKLGMPCVLKTVEGGYDGKGQVVIKQASDIAAAKQLAQKADCILEAWVDFACECSVMVARNGNHQVQTLPVSENIHENEILHESIVPARIAPELQEKARQMAEKIAHCLDLCGILGVEFFVGKDKQLYVNELAPRPHNSGHYSIEACDFSQFDLHNRAICNLPLPDVRLLSPVVMVNVLGQHVAGVRDLMEQKPNWHFHDYGKDEAKIDRKMGHVTILGADIDAILAEIAQTGVWDKR